MAASGIKCSRPRRTRPENLPSKNASARFSVARSGKTILTMTRQIISLLASLDSQHRRPVCRSHNFWPEWDNRLPTRRERQTDKLYMAAPILSYGTDDARESNWPIWPFILAIPWGFVQCTGTVLDGRMALNTARNFALGCIVIGVLIRVVAALFRGERNRRWIAYVVLLLFLFPIWMAVETSVQSAFERLGLPVPTGRRVTPNM